jgi:hypothetical protein
MQGKNRSRNASRDEQPGQGARRQAIGFDLERLGTGAESDGGRKSA